MSFRATVGVVLLAFVAHRAYYNRKYPPAKEETTDEMQGGWASVVATVFAIGGLLSLILFLVAPGSMSWASLPIPVWLRWVGVIPAVAGFGLLQWSHAALGGDWSDTPRTTRSQALVAHGPYQWIPAPDLRGVPADLGRAASDCRQLVPRRMFHGDDGGPMSMDGFATRKRNCDSRFGPAHGEYVKHTGMLLPRF